MSGFAVRAASTASLAVGAVIAVFSLAAGSGAATRGTSVPAAGRGQAPLSANPFLTGRTLVIPHGGGDGLFPENTLLAFEKSMAMGADVVDVDVRKTGDGVLVAFHDGTVARTTGAPGRVAAMSLAQLEQLDAGWGFSTGGRRPFRGKGVKVPTLEAILLRFPHALLSLDLKDESMSMVAPVCDLLTRYGRSTDVFVGSNGDDQILQFRKACPGVRTSATMVDVYAMRDARDSGAPYAPAALVDQPPFRMGNRTLVTKDGLDYAHRHGIAVLTWVVDAEADMRTLVRMGVDGIYTSYPDRLIRVLAQERRRAVG